MSHWHHHKNQLFQQNQSWNTPDPQGYQAYATIPEPLPNELPQDQRYPYYNMPNERPEIKQYPYSNGSFNTTYGGYVLEDPRRIGVVDYERAPVHIKANDDKDEERIDAEADEFIKLEHKKFQLSKTIKSYN